MSTLNQQQNDTKVENVVDANSQNIIEINDDGDDDDSDGCSIHKKTLTTHDKTPICIDLTVHSDEEYDSTNKSCRYKSSVVEYRTGFKGQQQNNLILTPKRSCRKYRSLESLDSECFNTHSSQVMSELSSIDSGAFNLKDKSPKALCQIPESSVGAYCSSKSNSVYTNPKKRKKSSSLGSSSESCVGFSKMFHPLRTEYSGYPKKFSRHWKWTNFGIKHQQESKQHCGFEFSIMSYNILAQDLLEDHSYLYTYCHSQILSWEYRKRCLLNEIDMLDPDIICLQEVQRDHYENFLKPEFERRGYEAIFCPKSNYQSDGCATFYKLMFFVLVSTNPIDYMRGGVLDRGNVGLIVGLKPRNPLFQKKDNCFYVANTHLLFNPRRGDVKLAQIILLLTELERITFKSQISPEKNLYHPFIMCGDFNTEPYSPIYKFIVSSYLRYEDLLIREMSGQKDENYGRDNYLSKDFFPANLNINSYCQYIHINRQRNAEEEKLMGKQATETDESSEVEGNVSPKLHMEDTAEEGSNVYPHTQTLQDKAMKRRYRPFHKGFIKHCFNLVSVYNHMSQIKGHFHTEVSTYHNKCCSTVDYIFYTLDNNSPQWQPQCSDEGGDKLRLISCYQLPYKEEVKDFDRLPNKQLGSDHFSLLASFLLV